MTDHELPHEELLRRYASLRETVEHYRDLLEANATDRLTQALVQEEFVHSIYSCTIIPARYGGTYEGSQWLAFPSYSVPDDAVGDDVSCAHWHGEYGKYLGHGDTPNQAAYDLSQKPRLPYPPWNHD